MTRVARKVLEDCRGAVKEIVDGIQGSAWRRRYVAAVVLLRTVGYVLKIDALQSNAYKHAIDNAWTDLNKSKPDPLIFWEFIDKERNNIIHEYEVRAGQGVTVHLGQNKAIEYHYLINDGQFQDCDQRDVLNEAINWWEEYLDGIDTAANNVL
jgi:hypothetical protein